MNAERQAEFRCGRAACAAVAVLFAGCGVHAYPHGQTLDSSNDFGPSAGAHGLPVSGIGGATPITTGASAGVPATGGGSGTSGTVSPAGTSGSLASAGTTAGQSAGTAGAAGAATAASPDTLLNLGGTPVAKEDAIAFIHIGHSNMAGRAIGPTADRPYYFTDTDPHAWMYHVGSMPALAKEPYTAGDDLSGTYGGPGTALLKQAVALAPDKYFISLGFGKESAYCSQFLPGALYYDTLIAAAKAIKDRVTFGAIVIMLGITERHGTMADITGYPQCINKLVTAIRTDVGVPDLPLLITDYEQNATGPLAPTATGFPQAIIPQIKMIPSVVANSVLVPTDGLTMQDDHHFDFEGHKVWTGRVLQLMQDHGWFPWK